MCVCDGKFYNFLDLYECSVDMYARCNLLC